MSQSIKKWLSGLSNHTDGFALRKLFEALYTDISALLTDSTSVATLQNNHLITSAGLAIAGGAKLTAQAVNAFFYIAGGTVGYKAAGDMSALVGTIADGSTAGWAFYIDSAGTITTSAKTTDRASVALAAADLVAIARPTGKAVIGYLIVSTAGAAFVGGTTALDAATATDVYFSLTGEDKAATASATLEA